MMEETNMLSKLPTKTYCNPHRICVHLRRQDAEENKRPLSKTNPKQGFFLNF